MPMNMQRPVETPKAFDEASLFDVTSAPLSAIPAKVQRLIDTNAAIPEGIACDHHMDRIRVQVPSGT